jgi:hypothetical protein
LLVGSPQLLSRAARGTITGRVGDFSAALYTKHDATS